MTVLRFPDRAALLARRPVPGPSRGALARRPSQTPGSDSLPEQAAAVHPRAGCGHLKLGRGRGVAVRMGTAPVESGRGGANAAARSLPPSRGSRGVVLPTGRRPQTAWLAPSGGTRATEPPSPCAGPRS